MWFYFKAQPPRSCPCVRRAYCSAVGWSRLFRSPQNQGGLGHLADGSACSLGAEPILLGLPVLIQNVPLTVSWERSFGAQYSWSATLGEEFHPARGAGVRKPKEGLPLNIIGLE